MGKGNWFFNTLAFIGAVVGIVVLWFFIRAIILITIDIISIGGDINNPKYDVVQTK